MNKVILVVVAVLFLASLYFLPADCGASPIPQVPAKGMVTMVDLGANKCLVCKMMSSIVESLQKEYQGKAAIVFIDVWKNPEAGQKFGINVIPTQIFYDKEGTEVYRHEGLMLKGAIISKLSEMGAK
ncbi:MAG: thioredoxin family protein [Syntrophobacteraceae bacterium]|nr:thioredoxin family protein [Syntrophobacteraceae bacterium]